MSKVVLVTGASSGIGRACAEYLATRGYRVFAGQRRASPVAGAESIALDVDDEASVSAAVAAIVAAAGRIDVVINNAGTAWMGAVEDTTIEEARAQLETNLFGVLRVCRAVMPIMRTQRAGRIIQISSLAGVLGLPFSGLYSASKFALEGMTEALRLEARGFGIHVSLVQPGDVDTGLPAARRLTAATAAGSDYRELFVKIKAAQDKDEQAAPAPIIVAKAIERVIRARSPKLRYHVGRWAQRIIIPLKRWLPQRLFQWILVQALGLPSPAKNL
jgi:NAD(P)-dependent dehydrogenase (short-subunit alcohol dehydrogenase family)